MCQTLSLPWWSVTSPQCWSHVAHLVCVSDRRQDQRLNVPQVCRRGHAPPPPGVSLTWSVTFVSGAGGPSAVVAGRWGRGDRGSPLLARGRIHSWNTGAQIYKSTYKTVSLVLNTFVSHLSSFLNVFFKILIRLFIIVEGTDAYRSWQKRSFVSFYVYKYSGRRR